jgi:fibronectin type 3 domain-containing protein
MGALGVGCPAGPENLEIAQVGASLGLSWNAPAWVRAGVDHYVVYRDTTGVPTMPLTTVPGADTSFIDVTVPPCERHNYWVTAVDTDGLEGALSNRATGELCYAGPADVTASFSEGANGVAWSTAEGSVEYYVVLRGNEAADPDSIGWVAAPETTYVDDTTDDCPRDSYRYEILPVYDTGWRGVISEHAAVDPAPAAPEGVEAEWATDDVILTWNRNCESDFGRYWVYRDTIPISPPINSELLVGFTPDTVFFDYGLDPGETYFYRVVASDLASRRSPYSETAWLGTGRVLGVPSPYGTIQAAINAASALDTVLVQPGTYAERITLKDGVCVVSSSGRDATMIESASGTIVTANSLSDLVLLRGFTVDGVGSAHIGLDAWGSYLKVEDCIFTGLISGATIQFGGSPMFTGNTFASNQSGLAVADSTAPAVFMNTFDGNVFAGVYADCDAGLRIGGSLADANDFVSMGVYHVFNNGTAPIDASGNYWDDICPQADWFYGPVEFVPWTDESHSWTYTECTGVPDVSPERAYAGENFPNPFNPSTAIRYVVPQPGARVRIEIYDLSGRRVRTLVDQGRDAGTYLTVWRGRDDLGGAVGSGVYFYRAEIGGYRVERKMVLLK